MKFTKPIVMACVAALVCSPLVATAATGKRAIRICSEAMAKQLVRADNVQRSLKVDFKNSVTGGLLGYREVFYMTAESTNGETIARFECVVDKWAHVQELRQVPLTGEEWPLLSQK